VVVTVGPEEEGKSSNSCNFERIMNIYMILLNINLIINFEGSSLHIGLNERHLRQKPQNCERWIHLDYMFISGTVSCDYSVFLKKTKMKCSKVSLHSNIKNQSCQLQLCYKWFALSLAPFGAGHWLHSTYSVMLKKPKVNQSHYPECVNYDDMSLYRIQLTYSGVIYVAASAQITGKFVYQNISSPPC
jgi:hypothetical protein